ncbi:MAG: hypothetical protein ABSF23_10625 [Terracidiphilus sp.]|jgi:hypothetical protein
MAPNGNEAATVDRARETAARLGWWVSVLTAVVAIAAFGIGFLTPPHSGPFCTASCIAYPYSGAVAFFPRDYLWVFPGMLLVSLFVALCICVDLWVNAEKRVFSRIAVAAATVSAALVTLDYFIQFEVMQPSLLHGESDGLAFFSQYNPHGAFIAMEDLGYLGMSAAFIFLGVSLAGRSGLEKATRWLLAVSGALGFVTFIGMTAAFGNNLETRFELAIITIVWTVLPVAATMLAILFRRSVRPAAS